MESRADCVMDRPVVAMSELMSESAMADCPPNDRSLSLCLFGAAPDTGNHGVSALCFGTLAGLLRAARSLDVTVFDYGRGIRSAKARLGGRELSYRLCGASDTRRIYRRESFWKIRVCARLGGLGNPAARTLLTTDAILDISGGDSFTDLYGSRRFWAVATPKIIALELRKPLVLLPQTYGPFRSDRLRRAAEAIVRGSAMAWARDERSFQALKELAGNQFDPDRHRCGVDVAFALEAHEPAKPLPPYIQRWLDQRDEPIVAVNISGLIYNDPARARIQYGLKVDYPELLHGLLLRLLRESGARIILLPHVLTPVGHYESDPQACDAALERLGDAANGRVAVLPPVLDQSETKWLIARMDWFCGTRMHSTIAALSSGVPAASISYSLKAAGVFESCGQGDCVADARQLDTDQAIDQVWQSWCGREQARASLQARLPKVLQQASEQAGLIVARCASRSAQVAASQRVA